jgi:hypothetical protein
VGLRGVGVALVAAAGSVLGIQDDRPFPAEVPAVSAWERIDGRVERTDGELRYSLYVDPRFPGLYRLTHYQVFEGPPGPETRRESRVEALIWNPAPGERRPLHCYRWDAARAAGAEGPAREAGWRALESGSDEYREEILRTQSVYNVHRTLRLNAE